MCGGDIKRGRNDIGKYKTEHRVCGTGQLIKSKKSQLVDY
jgi:hypothetical protein